MPRRNLIWITSILAAAAVLVWVTRQPSVPPDDPDMVRFRSVVRAYRIIRDKHLLEPGDDELLRGALGGIVAATDEYSTYIPPDKLERFTGRMDGRDAGLGLRTRSDSGQVKVVNVQVGSPAWRAGICYGHWLIAADGRLLGGMVQREVDALLDVQIGAELELAVATVEGTRTVCLTSGRFTVQTVTGLGIDSQGRWIFLVDPDERIAYVRIREFVRDTGDHFHQTLASLGQVRGLVLDLRGNPGGLLPPATEVANKFLRKGVIVTVLGRTGSRQEHRAHVEGTYSDVPMVVLIDNQTASAAEIVAGALGFGDRAVLVGARTRGKGFVQSMIPLPDDLGQVNLTTAEFLLGSGQSISRRGRGNNWGVDPHEQVAIPGELKQYLLQLRGRAEAPPAAPATRPAGATASQPRRAGMARLLAGVDPQLGRAVELLRDPDRIASILELAANRRAEMSRRVVATRDSATSK